MDFLRRARPITTLLALSAALAAVSARAQVAPAAYRGVRSLTVGAEFADVSASFPYQSGQRLQGVGAFADFHLYPHLSVEGDARFLHFGGFENSTESSYLAGPKAYFLEFGKFRPYAKFLVGEGKIHYPFAIGDASYLALAPGGGVDCRISRRLSLRAGYEYQMWLNSPGFAHEPKHELTPNGFHIGVAYRVFR